MRKSLVAAALATALTAPLPAAAGMVLYKTHLSGAAESPPNASPGTGLVELLVDTVASTMEVKVDFSGLVGTVTASHIHCCTAVPGVSNAGVATVTPTFTGFPSGVTSGSYDHVFDMLLASSWNPASTAFLALHGGDTALAFHDFLAGIDAGKAYLNVHSTFRPGGEIRGFLAVPEPAGLLLLLSAVGAMLGVSGRRRQAA